MGEVVPLLSYLLTTNHGEWLPTTPISLFYTILVFGKFSLKYLRLLTTPFNIPTGLGINSVPCASYNISFRPLPTRLQAAGWEYMASWPYPCSSVPGDYAETPRWVLCTQWVCHIWEIPDSETVHLQQAGSTLAQALLRKGSLVSWSWTGNSTQCPSRRHWLHLAGLFTTQKSLRRYFRTKSSGSLPRKCTDMWETELLLFFLLEDNCFTIVSVFAIHQHESAIGIYMPPVTAEPPSHLPLHPNSASYNRAPDLSSLSHTANSHWLSILHMVMYMFQCYSINSTSISSPTVSASLFSVSSLPPWR